MKGLSRLRQNPTGCSRGCDSSRGTPVALVSWRAVDREAVRGASIRGSAGIRVSAGGDARQPPRGRLDGVQTMISCIPTAMMTAAMTRNSIVFIALGI